MIYAAQHVAPLRNASQHNATNAPVSPRDASFRSATLRFARQHTASQRTPKFPLRTTQLHGIAQHSASCRNTTQRTIPMFNPTNPEHAAIIQRLCAELSALSIGGTADYKSLSKVAARNVQNGHRYLLTAAMEKAEKEQGCIYAAVRGVGIKRLASADIPETGLAALRRARRAAKRGKKRIDRVKTNSLNDSERRRLIGYSAMLGAVVLVSDGRRAGSIAAVADPAKPIPPANILDMFR